MHYSLPNLDDNKEEEMCVNRLTITFSTISTDPV